MNHVRKIYEPFSAEELSQKITQLVSPQAAGAAKSESSSSRIENLHSALPNHSGDWYFTGNYPTPGGFRVVNQAFVKFFGKAAGRAY